MLNVVAIAVAATFTNTCIILMLMQIYSTYTVLIDDFSGIHPKLAQRGNKKHVRWVYIRITFDN